MIKDEMTKKLGFGCMRLPILDGDTEKIDDEQFCKMIDTFMEKGFTYFDTAFPYHNEKSEPAVKRCLVDRYERSKFFLATKMPVWNVHEYADYEKYFNMQLERTGAGYFDFYLLHALGKDRIEECEKFGGFEFIQKMKAEGKIRYAGFSFHDSADVLEEALTRHPEVDFVQLQINYYDWDSKNVQSGKCYEVATRHGVPVVVMEPIKGGTLANLAEGPANILHALDPEASIASFAVRYVASLDNVFMVLSGMSTYEQLADNTSYMENFKPLSAEEQEAIQKVVAELKKLPTIPCTKCRYCVAGCPQEILIPDLFQAYNDTVQFGVNPITMRGFNNAVNNGHCKPSECIKCGACEDQCPQHLEIRDLLEKVAATFEK
ncbi:MAG: aldo/keto reductase [Clostridiales bacterium]|nr:aldo/keto reductase [Candidatus Blautia equi]